MDEIDGIDFAKLGTDVKGDIFEYMLTHLGQSALNGQFRTPRQIRTMMVDMVDPDTAEVTKANVLWEAIRACCSSKPDYITADTPLLDGIFRLFLTNGNQPLSILELHERLDKKPPEMILRMLTKGQVYMGIRPVW